MILYDEDGQEIKVNDIIKIILKTEDEYEGIVTAIVKSGVDIRKKNNKYMFIPYDMIDKIYVEDITYIIN